MIDKAQADMAKTLWEQSKAAAQQAHEAWWNVLKSQKDWGGAAFRWKGPGNPEGGGTTVWSPFAADTSYFAPSTATFMINYRVEDLHAVLAALRAEGVQVEEKVDESEYGKFGWVVDPEGNKLELWQPPAGQ